MSAEDIARQYGLSVQAVELAALSRSDQYDVARFLGVPVEIALEVKELTVEPVDEPVDENPAEADPDGNTGTGEFSEPSVFTSESVPVGETVTTAESLAAPEPEE